MEDDRHDAHRRWRGAHSHGVMTGWIVGPYDLLVGGLLMRGNYRRVATDVARQVPAGGAVCDVGTGPGRLVLELARRRPDLTVTGIDPSAEMLARGRRRAAALPNAAFVEAPAEAIPLPDGSCDAVVSTLSSHHWADFSAALAEQARVLRPGGRLWLYDLRRELPPDAPQLVGQAGLSVLPVDPALGWFNRRRLRLVAADKS